MATGYPLAFRVNPRFTQFALDPDGASLIWRRRVHWKDFNVAATTANLDIKFPGNLVIERAYLSLITVFAGGSVSAATLSLGTTGSPATYLAATNVFTGATASGNVTVAAGAGLGSVVSGASTPTSVGTIRCQLLTTTDNASNLTGGTADIFIRFAALSFKLS